MNTQDFTTTIVVDQSPKEVFEVLKDARSWWSGLHGEVFEGSTDQLNESFTFWAGEGMHYTKQKLIEIIPNKKIVWEVTDSRLTFVATQDEWTGTKICFEITPVGNKTQIVFTHLGLVPQFECYDSCAPAWTQYIQEQLKNLFKGNTQDFTTSIVVDQTPKEAFKAITNVRGWWSEEIEGSSEQLNDVFDYHFEDIHRCQIKLIEVVPDKKIVWHIVDNYFKPGIFDEPETFVNAKSEWTDTTILFEISEKDNKTKIQVTHQGLNPSFECYDVCSNSWTHYIQDSLKDLITTGKGQPNATGRAMTTDEEKFQSAKK